MCSFASVTVAICVGYMTRLGCKGYGCGGDSVAEKLNRRQH